MRDGTGESGFASVCAVKATPAKLRRMDQIDGDLLASSMIGKCSGMQRWSPGRGEIWWVDLGETVGHEQAGVRPALVLSDTRHDPRQDGNLLVVPITTRDRGIPLHVRVGRGEGGLPEPSVLLTDQVRAVSRLRLESRIGVVSPRVMLEVERMVAKQILPGWSPGELAACTPAGTLAG